MRSVIELLDFLEYEEDIELYSSSQISFPKVPVHKYPFIFTFMKQFLPAYTMLFMKSFLLFALPCATPTDAHSSHSKATVL